MKWINGAQRLTPVKNINDLNKLMRHSHVVNILCQWNSAEADWFEDSHLLLQTEDMDLLVEWDDQGRIHVSFGIMDEVYLGQHNHWRQLVDFDELSPLPISSVSMELHENDKYVRTLWVTMGRTCLRIAPDGCSLVERFIHRPTRVAA